MERLTHRNGNGDLYFIADGKKIRIDDIWLLRVAERLSYYEDLEAQGKLIATPCAVGDTLFRIVDRGTRKDTCATDCYSCNIECPYEGREDEKVFEIVPWKMSSMAVIANAIERLGKTVFLTREEAATTLESKSIHKNANTDSSHP